MSSAELPGDGGPAFARSFFWTKGMQDGSPSQVGMTLRDYFAAKAMQAMLSRPDAQVENLNDSLQTLLRAVSEMSYAAADEMLRARAPARCEQTPQEPK